MRRPLLVFVGGLVLAIYFIYFFISYTSPKYDTADIIIIPDDNVLDSQEDETEPPKSESIFEQMLQSVKSHIQNELNTNSSIVRADLYGKLRKEDYFTKFVPKNNGTPIRTILVSTWRSGSSFIIQLLSSLPSTLLYYEPGYYLFSYSSTPRIRGPPLGSEAIDMIRALLTCEHESHPKIAQGMRIKAQMFLPRIHKYNEIKSLNKTLCRNPKFTGEMCKMVPFHFMKLVRLHLNQTEDLLADKSLNVKIIYLLRDPRATLNSRKHLGWCTETQECATELCTDLDSEFYTAQLFTRKYPNSFRVLRYEDLTQDIVSVTKELMYFLGFEMHPSVIEYIDGHTASDKTPKNPFNLIRNTSIAGFHWREELSFKEVKQMQNICQAPMKLWGYKMATSPENQKIFTPYLHGPEYNVQDALTNN